LGLGGFEALEGVFELGFGFDGSQVYFSYAAGDQDDEDCGPGEDEEVKDQAGEEVLGRETDLEDTVVGDDSELLEEEEGGVGNATEDSERGGGIGRDDEAGVHDDDDIDKGEETGIRAAEEVDDKGDEEDVEEEFQVAAKGEGWSLLEVVVGDDEDHLNGGEDPDWNERESRNAEGPEEEGGEEKDCGRERPGGDIHAQNVRTISGRVLQV